METTTAPSPVATSNLRQPRKAETYRGARRNAGRNNWPDHGSNYEPYKTRPDRFRLVKVPDGDGGTKTVRERYARPQPKTYHYASLRQITRNKWRHERFVAANPHIFAVAA